MSTLTSTALLALSLMPGLAAAQGSQCHARVELKLDDEVENPRDAGFLSSLAASPGYSLTFVRTRGSRFVYDVIGPGTDPQCSQGIEMLRRNASVLDLRVTKPKSS